MMPYYLAALVSSKFSRSIKDTSYDVMGPISDWKLKLNFLSSSAMFLGKMTDVGRTDALGRTCRFFWNYIQVYLTVFRRWVFPFNMDRSRNWSVASFTKKIIAGCDYFLTKQFFHVSCYNASTSFSVKKIAAGYYFLVKLASHLRSRIWKIQDIQVVRTIDLIKFYKFENIGFRTVAVAGWQTC